MVLPGKSRNKLSDPVENAPWARSQRIPQPKYSEEHEFRFKSQNKTRKHDSICKGEQKQQEVASNL